MLYILIHVIHFTLVSCKYVGRLTKECVPFQIPSVINKFTLGHVANAFRLTLTEMKFLQAESRYVQTVADPGFGQRARRTPEKFLRF